MEPILQLVNPKKPRKKRYYEDLQVFNFGRASFQVHEADGKYWVKNRVGWPEMRCLDCYFRNKYPNGACQIFACQPHERFDGKDVVFERIC